MITGNHYQLLGVAPTASQEEIKKAYRSLSKQYHPDMYPGDKKKEEVFRLISEAYAVLSNAEKRKDYDNSLLLDQKRQRKAEKGNSNRKGNFYSTDGFNPQNMAAGFADFWGFSPGQDLSSMKSKKKENSTNPIDMSDLFNRYMGIKK